MADLKPFEPENNLEIKTKSIEQTLLPLVKQVCFMYNLCKVIG